MSRSSNEILLGPVNKNKALRDVEFVLHCLAGVPFSSDTAQEYAITSVDVISAPRLFENSQGQILAECPNGKIYNLSVALRNANFEYFCLTPALHTPLLIALQNLIENPNTQPILARKLIGGDKDRPIFQIEEDSICEYTASSENINSYEQVNTLLRGQSMKQYNLDETDLKKLLVASLLVISGANKNVSPVIDFELELASEIPTAMKKNKLYVRQQGQDIQYIVKEMQNWQTISSSEFKTGTPDLSDLTAARSSILTITSVRGHTPTPVETKKITRLIEKMPAGISSEMILSLLSHHLAGLMSFSKLDTGASSFTCCTLRINVNYQGRTNSIEAISKTPGEKEVLLPPGSLTCLPVDPRAAKTDSEYAEIYAKNVYGPGTEKNDHYLSELALSWAYEKHLRHLYKDAPREVRGAIYRPNHALAHHVRVTSYTNEVISYFAAFAANEGFKNFCAGLSPYDIEIIKILTAFSKTGRESECTFTSDPERYQRDKDASAKNMSHFMKQYLELSEEELATYKEIVSMMGDPSYKGNEEKYYISHIITLAHKLDLPRCYDATQWQNALKIYHSGDLIQNTAKQITAFDALKELALCTIAETGDGYLVSSATNSEQFKPCNTDLLYCLDRCVLARNLIHVTDERQRARLKSIDQYIKYENILKKNNYASIYILILSEFLQMMQPSLDQKKRILKYIIDEKVGSHEAIKQLLIIPGWTDDEKQQILANAVKGFVRGEFKGLRFADSQIFFDAWTAEQVQQILAAAVAKADWLMTTFDDVERLLKVPELLKIPKWSNEQQQKILDVAIAKADCLSFFDTAILTLLKIPEWSDEQKQQISAVVVAKADRIITCPKNVLTLLKISELSDEQKQQILATAVTKADCIITRSYDVLALLNISEWSDEQKQQILATAVAKVDRLICSVRDVSDLLKIPEWSDKQKQQILDAVVAKAARICTNVDNVLRLLNISKWSDKQKQQILAASIAKVDRIMTEYSDVSRLLKMPEWSDEQKQQILATAVAKTDLFIVIPDYVLEFSKIPGWSDEQKQQILDAALAKGNCQISTGYDVLTLLKIPALSDEQKQQILAVGVAKAARICINVDDVLKILNIPELTEQHKRQILDAAVRAGFIDIPKMISITQTVSGPGFFQTFSPVTDARQDGKVTEIGSNNHCA